MKGWSKPFNYNLPEPAGDADFAAIEIGACPWRPDRQLARIAIKARAGASTVAEDAKTEACFNSAAVRSYRLLGYDDANSGTGTGEQIAGGHVVTALYELIPAANAKSSADILTLSVHYNRPGSTVEQVIQFQGRAANGANVSADFRFAAGVAEFAMLLGRFSRKGRRQSKFRDSTGRTAPETDASGEREQFIELARRVKQLLG